MRTALYAGSFDPLTNGHLWVIKQESKIFDHLVVAVAHNPEKKYTFDVSERVAMIAKTVFLIPCNNIIVTQLDNLFLVDFARLPHIRARFLLRGIRNEDDYRKEIDMRDQNKKLAPEIETVFLSQDMELRRVSSSFVKSLVGPTGWEDAVQDLLPPSVHQEFIKRFRK